MVALATVNRSAYAARIARLLQQDGNNPSQLFQVFSQFFGDPDPSTRPTRVITTGGMRTVNNAACCRTANDKIIIVVSGVTGFKAQTFIGGYGNYSIMSREAYGFNVESFRDASTQLFESVRRLGRVPSGFYLYGYSAGGVLVEAFAKYLRTIAVPQVDELVTFGAPKGAGQGDYVEARRVTRVRWMCAGDPVPAFPFSGVSGTLSIALSLSGRNYRPDLLAHGTGGQILTRDGFIREGDETRDYPPQNVESAANWLIGNDDLSSYPHSLNSYVNRLDALSSRITQGQRPELPAAQGLPVGPHAVNPPTAPIVQGPQDGPIVAIRRSRVTAPDGSQTSLVPVTGVGPMALPVVHNSMKLKTQRSGAMWLVLWDDVIVATCKNASSAKRIASSWNRSLRLLGTALTISESGLIAYLQAFLGEAASGEGGVVPPFNVQN